LDGLFGERSGGEPSAAATYGGFVAVGMRGERDVGPVMFVSGSVAPRQTEGAVSVAWTSGRIDLCHVGLAYAASVRSSLCGALAVDATYVYFADSGSGIIGRIPK
jgi:hypothetical protein